jgi:DNA end-binding protein Ku
MYDKPYYLEADGPGMKPYVLLRDALKKAGKAAVVKVALRSRESIALIRVVDDVLLLQTLLWPDEVRDAGFAAPPDEIRVSDAEVAMASMFIDQMSGEFDAAAHTDAYREALEKVVEAKLSGVAIAEEAGEAPKQAEVVDLVAALRASVEAAKKRRDEEQGKAAAATGKKAG